MNGDVCRRWSKKKKKHEHNNMLVCVPVENRLYLFIFFLFQIYKSILKKHKIDVIEPKK